ncbi:hypothetical protein [Arenibacter latericius]|uniref:hypothetical protein n=1 Tax=Arenibacter latericius TaxID=86104 RepID=UPI0004254E6A|nr:hypothetical protein [Arenibacter latericius]MDX1364434.1 hypothetical protein [Arenibacter latericius]
MNYRIKSLFYLIAFVASALICNHLQEDSYNEKEVLTIENNEKVDNTIASLE